MVRSRLCVQRRKLHSSGVSCIVALSDGGWASSGGGDGGVIAWCGADGRVHRSKTHHDHVFCLAALRDGGWASGGNDGVVAVWLPGWSRPARLMMYESIRHIVVLSGWDETGGHLAVAMWRGPVYVLRVDRLSSPFGNPSRSR